MTIYLVVLMSFLSQAGFGGSRVAVALHALELTSNQFAIGLIIALYSICPMLLAITIGRFADRTPPRKMILLGSILLPAALVLPCLFPNLGVLYVSAVVLGFAHQVFSLPQEAIVGGIGGPEKRARNYAFITMAWSAANFIGPVVAGFSIDHIGQRQAYLVLAALTAAPILVLVLNPTLLSTTTSGRHKSADKHGSVLELWRMPALRNTMIAAGIVGSAQDLFQFYMPIYGHSVGLSASAIGTIMGLSSLAAFVIRAILPFLSRKATEMQILLGAIVVSAAAFLLFPFFQSAWALGAIAFLLGLGVGCAFPMTMSLLYALAPANRLAEAFGLHKTLRNATHLAVPLLFGTIGTMFGYVAVFLSNSTLLAAGGALVRKVVIPRSREEDVPSTASQVQRPR
jgi:predicted MFS family arabinose efflux permease